jgi:hypothetical protein
MTQRKRPDVRGKPVSAADMKCLRRIYRKYGKASFAAACRDVQIQPGRGSGRSPTHDDNDLFTVYLALHESVSKIGILKTCHAFAGRVPMSTGKEKYTAGGLRTLYAKAAKRIERDPGLAHIAKLHEDTRAGRIKPPQIIGEKIPEVPAAGVFVPDIRRLSEEEVAERLRARRAQSTGNKVSVEKRAGKNKTDKRGRK